MIRKLELLAMILYDLAQCRVMNMAYTGKQMVLYLVVQSTYSP
jgi:hypothetical protein